MSQAVAVDHDAEQEAALSASLLEALELGPTAVLGASCGGCSSIVLAATRPDLVSRLVLYGAYSDGSLITTPEVRDSLAALVRAHWGLGSRTLADVFMPDADAAEREDFARYQRHVETGEAAARQIELVWRLDASRWVERVGVPTIVLHRRGDRAVPPSLGHELAARIPDARFVSLPGRNHFPWVGDVDSMLRPVAAFLGDETADAGPEPEDDVLSSREREVLGLVARGLSDAEIADELVLSPHTVHRHVANVRRKLRQPSRAAAVAEAARLGLLAGHPAR
jgi:DNA-binding CsgD family transcriptional regulator/pimeloyl-ACP methyl ester carboxylesterase